MKKLLLALTAVISVAALLFCGCTADNTRSTLPLPAPESSGSSPNGSEADDSSVENGTLSPIPSDEISSAESGISSSAASSLSDKNGGAVKRSSVTFKAVWIEYTDSLFSKTNRELFTKTALEKFSKIKSSGFNAVILHVRANADAVYKSSYFPYSAHLTGKQGTDPGFDPLEIAVKIAHDVGLEIHAWVNPYRVSAASDDINSLCESNIARIWKTDGNKETDSYVIPWGGKLYFNPSCPEVQKLVLNGIREILDNYEVDGIHFDDYFYPSSDVNFDIGSYAKYCRKTAYPMSQGDWRRANVDTLVSAVYRLVNSYGKYFGISPAAPISKDNSDRNYNQYFINVKKWMANKGYIDYIAPQLYFGYEHKLASTRFDVLLKAWSETERLDSVKLYIGLAAYKVGLKNDADLTEWADKDDILKREYEDCTESTADGIIMYNYSSMFSPLELNTAQRNNLLSIMNEE